MKTGIFKRLILAAADHVDGMELSLASEADCLKMEGAHKVMSLPSQVVSQATHALKRSSHPALRKLSVEGTPETLIISGKVTSYYLKQMAQETIMPVRGTLALVNRIDVIPS
jgi:hypothetical protein